MIILDCTLTLAMYIFVGLILVLWHRKHIYTEPLSKYTHVSSLRYGWYFLEHKWWFVVCRVLHKQKERFWPNSAFTCKTSTNEENKTVMFWWVVAKIISSLRKRFLAYICPFRASVDEAHDCPAKVNLQQYLTRDMHLPIQYPYSIYGIVCIPAKPLGDCYETDWRLTGSILMISMQTWLEASVKTFQPLIASSVLYGLLADNLYFNILCINKQHNMYCIPVRMVIVSNRVWEYPYIENSLHCNWYINKKPMDEII